MSDLYKLSSLSVGNITKLQEPKLMKRLSQKFSKKNGSEIAQQTLSNNDSQSNDTLTSVNDLDRGKLDDSMREVSKVLDGARDITGKHLEHDNKAYRCKQVAANLLQRLSAFTNLVQSIADAHPYAKMAWTIISSIVEIITNTQDVDQNILQLFETLDTTYKFLEETKEIENYPSYKRILSTLAKQTVDCGYFIRDYAKNANFWIRVGKNIIGGPIKTRIETYRTTFCNLLEEFRTHSSLHTELAVGRVLEGNQEICEALYLDSLPYAAGAGLNTGKQCLLGTRIEVLDEIIEWVNDGDESCPRLFWLAGTAGVGKSAIAHSIAAQFRSIKRLGSFFCFDRNYSFERRRDKIFSTIARDLADLDPRIKHELAKVIRDDTSLRTTTDLHLQWKNFIFEPLNAISEVNTGPILIIVDALDECDNPSSRQDLLKVLETGIRTLPVNVRLLITSRPESDIKITFKNLESHIRTKIMDTIPESESERDILTYLKTKLDSFGDTQLMHLVLLSQGLFQWAYLASQFLNGLGNSAGLTVTERYENLIRTQHIQFINDPLDIMYTQILSSLFNPDDSMVMTRFHSVIGSIITSSEPLSLNTLITLRGDREKDIKVVIQYMGSLLSGIDDPSSTIRPLHLSFRDYLLDPNRSHRFSINPSPCDHDFAVGCIRTMMEELRFNLCDIPDSHKRNSDYEDLPARVLSSISIPLSYSCRFWALHVSRTGFDSSLARRVEEFLYHGFLLWLEVLSLVGAINVAAKLMSRLISWSSREQSHKGLHDFVVDGRRFVRLFGDAIAASAPHIYLSALPFCPQDSIIYKTYIKQFPNTLRIASDPIRDWSLVSIGSDVGDVKCIVFSHGGEYLAISLLKLGIFELLDSETLDILWIKDVPDEIVYAIQFSWDDGTLVLATRTKIYFFDILSGDLTLYLDIQTNSPWKTRFSWGAQYIAFLCESNLIVWNLETKEETINIPFDNQYESIAGFEFSSVDDLFITYFVDIGAQVWNLETGTVLHGPFQPPQNITIDQTIVSPNGKDIFILVFLDNISELYKWNFRDRSLLDFDVEYSIYNISISPNGDCVTMESFGRLTLRDMNGKELDCGIDYEDLAHCNTFSKDGKHLASCDRGRLTIWELDGWQTTPSIHQSTLSPVRLSFLCVSSDGKYFLANHASTGEYNCDIWDLESEQLIWAISHFEGIILPFFSPMNQYLAYLCDGQTAAIYDLCYGITKEFGSRSSNEESYLQGLAFSQDETYIATFHPHQGRIDVWDVASCEMVDTLTIPKATATTGVRWKFRPSSKFQYFAYISNYSNEHNIFLFSLTRSIPSNFLICEKGHTDSDMRFSEDFSFDLDEKHMLVSCRSTIFHINLITEEHRAVALQKSHISDGWKTRRIHFVSSSDAILVEIYSSRGYNIWNVFSGQLLYFALLGQPDVTINAFLPIHRNLFTATKSFNRILTLDAKQNDQICFSSNEQQHSLKTLPFGSSARLREDGWVITQNNGLLFWIPNRYRETLYTPNLKYIIKGKPTELDLSSFSHGQSWASCRATVDDAISE
ncbi:hypothetical protein Clacol_005333 [Clathrus columnatus]|uniref:NACHT domain-containing protein n=1 Tax=Clathrus columnatus TaxID=1419009 RepID=A0AAV5A902_9AGAM|nr:hypothetical protein Clacol_005333 [Clathrus columnatus]